MGTLKKLFLLLLILITAVGCKAVSTKTVSGIFSKILEPVTITVTPDAEMGEMILTDDESEIVITVANNSSDEIRSVLLDLDISENLINFKPSLDGTVHSPGQGGTCGSVVAAGTTCTFQLVLVPRKQGEFNIKATVNYINKIEHQKKDINFHLIAGEPASLVFTNDNANYSLGVFEQTDVVDRTIDVEIMNGGGLPARNLDVVFEDGSTNFIQKPFKLVSHNCPSTLFMKAKCKLTIGYTPRNNKYEDPEEMNTANLTFKYTNDPKATVAQLVGYFSFTSSTIEAKFNPNYKIVDFRKDNAYIVTGNKQSAAIRVTNQGYREGILKSIILRRKAVAPATKGVIAAICVKSANNFLDCQKRRMSDYPALFSADEIAQEAIDTGVPTCTVNCNNTGIYDFPFIVEDVNACFGREVVSIFNADATHSSSCVYNITYWPSVAFTKADHDAHDFNTSTLDFRYDSKWRGNLNLVTKKGIFENTADYIEKAKIKIVRVEVGGDPLPLSDINLINDNLGRIDFGRIAKLATNSTAKTNINIFYANVGEDNLVLTELRDGKTPTPFIVTAADLVGKTINSYYTGLSQSNCDNLGSATYTAPGPMDDPLVGGTYTPLCSISFDLSPNKKASVGPKLGSEFEDELMYDTVQTSPSIIKIKKFILTYKDGSSLEDDGTPIASRQFETDMKSLLVAKAKLAITNASPTLDFGKPAIGDSKVLYLKLENVGTGPMPALQFRYDAKTSPYNFSLEVGNNLPAGEVLANKYTSVLCANADKKILPGGASPMLEEYCPVTGTLAGTPGTPINYNLVTDVTGLDRKYPYTISRFLDHGEDIKAKTGDANATKDCADLILHRKLNIPFSAPAGHDLSEYILPEERYCYLRIEASVPKNSITYDRGYPLAGSIPEFKRFWAKNLIATTDIWSVKPYSIPDVAFKFNSWDGDDNADDRPKSLVNFGYAATTYPTGLLKSAFIQPTNIYASDVTPMSSATIFRPVITYPEITSNYPSYSKLASFSVPLDPTNDTQLMTNIFTFKNLTLGLGAATNLAPILVKDADIRTYYKYLGAEFYASNTTRFNYFLGTYQPGVDNFATISFASSGQPASKYRLTNLATGDAVFNITKFKNQGYVLGTDLTSGSGAFDMVVKFNLPSNIGRPYQNCYKLYYEMTLSNGVDTKNNEYEFCLVAVAANAPLLKIEYQNWDVDLSSSTHLYTETTAAPATWLPFQAPLNRFNNTLDEFGNTIAVDTATDRSILMTTVAGATNCETTKDCSYDLKKIKITNIGTATLAQLETDIVTTGYLVAKSGSNPLLLVMDDVGSPNTICSKNDGSAFLAMKDRIAICKSDLNACQHLTTSGASSSCILRVYFTPTTKNASIIKNFRLVLNYPTDVLVGHTGAITYASQYIPVQYQGLDTIIPTMEGAWRSNADTFGFTAVTGGNIVTRTGVSPNYNYAAKDAANPYTAIANWSDPTSTFTKSGFKWWTVDLGTYANDNITTAKKAYHILNATNNSRILYMNLLNNNANKVSFLLANGAPETNQAKQSAEKTSNWYQIYPPYNDTAANFDTYNAAYGKSKAIIYATTGCFYGADKLDASVPGNQKGFNSTFDNSTAAKTCQLKINFTGDFAYNNCSVSGATPAVGTKEVSFGGNIDFNLCNPYIYEIPLYTYKRTGKSTFNIALKGFMEPDRSTTVGTISAVGTKYISATAAEISLTLPTNITENNSALGTKYSYRVFWSKNLTTMQSNELYKMVPTDATFKTNVAWKDVPLASPSVILSSSGCTSTTLCKVDPKAYYYVKVMMVRNLTSGNPNYNLGTSKLKYFISDPKIPMLTVVTPDANTYYAHTLKTLGDRGTIGSKTTYSTAVNACKAQYLLMSGHSSNQFKSLIDIPTWNYIRPNAGNTFINSATTYGSPTSIGTVPHWLFETTPINVKLSASLMKFDGTFMPTASVFTDWNSQSSFNYGYNISYVRSGASGTFLLNKIAGGDTDTIPDGMNYYDQSMPYGFARCKIDLKCPLTGLTSINLSDVNCSIVPGL